VKLSVEGLEVCRREEGERETCAVCEGDTVVKVLTEKHCETGE
jgi:hypothetical protein